MSTVATTPQNRIWMEAGALLIGVCVAVAGIAWVVRADERPGVSPSGSAPALSRVQVDAAPWHVTVFPAGAMGRVTKAETARVKRQNKDLAALLDTVYGAVVNSSNDLTRVLEKNFSKAAARAFRSSVRLVPEGATASRVTKRYARIGVDAGGARTAAAFVSLIVRGKAPRAFKIRHRATLWLERQTKWRVIGFEILQRPK